MRLNIGGKTPPEIFPGSVIRVLINLIGILVETEDTALMSSTCAL